MQTSKVRVVAGVVGAGVLALASYLSPSTLGVTEIQKQEGLRYGVYLDPVGIATVCTGSTGPDVRLGMPTQTPAECEVRLRKDLTIAVRAIQLNVVVPISQRQFDALVSFVFNVGGGAFSRSTMLYLINTGQCTAATLEFPKWNKAKGKVLKGLVIRRAGEADWFGKDCPLWVH